MEEEWIFTFCQDSKLKNHYIVFKGSYGEARTQMFENFNRWAFQYASREEAGVEKYGLIELKEFEL